MKIDSILLSSDKILATTNEIFPIFIIVKISRAFYARRRRIEKNIAGQQRGRIN